MTSFLQVTVFDQVPVFARLGDTIGIMPNACVARLPDPKAFADSYCRGRIIGRWPGLFEVLDPLCGHARGIKILRWDGKHIVDQMTPTPTDEAGWEAERAARRESPDFDAHRGDLVSFRCEATRSSSDASIAAPNSARLRYCCWSPS